MSRASENYKKKVKSVNPVFKPSREILVELPNEEVSALETDTRIICTSKTYKKKVKWVMAVFKLFWKILAKLPNKALSTLNSHQKHL
jgi:hypothetical protein